MGPEGAGGTCCQSALMGSKVTVRGTHGVTQDQCGSGEWHFIGAVHVDTSRYARGLMGSGKLVKVVQQPSPSASLHGLGQPLHLCSLLAPDGGNSSEKCCVNTKY